MTQAAGRKRWPCRTCRGRPHRTCGPREWGVRGSVSCPSSLGLSPASHLLSCQHVTQSKLRDVQMSAGVNCSELSNDRPYYQITSSLGPPVQERSLNRDLREDYIYVLIQGAPQRVSVRPTCSLETMAKPSLCPAVARAGQD